MVDPKYLWRLISSCLALLLNFSVVRESRATKIWNFFLVIQIASHLSSWVAWYFLPQEHLKPFCNLWHWFRIQSPLRWRWRDIFGFRYIWNRMILPSKHLDFPFRVHLKLLNRSEYCFPLGAFGFPEDTIFLACSLELAVQAYFKLLVDLWCNREMTLITWTDRTRLGPLLNLVSTARFLPAEC